MQRKTEQRDAIRKVFAEAERPLSVQEVLSLSQKYVPGVGIATIYRNLKALVESGWLTPVELPGEANRYEMAGLHHHHHFSCHGCQRVFDVDGCPKGIERILPKGFSLDKHEVILYGQCAECNQG